MTCTVTKIGPVTVFSCSRSGSSPSCKCGRRATVSCQFALTGSKTGQVCGQSICDRCSTDRGIALCPVHARMAAKESVRS
jgi:hypothetical protein